MSRTVVSITSSQLRYLFLYRSFFVSNSYIVAEKPATTQTASNTSNQGSDSGQTTNQGTDPGTAAKTDGAATDAQLVNSEFVALLNADREGIALLPVADFIYGYMFMP